MGIYEPTPEKPSSPPLSKRLHGHPIWGVIGIIMAVILPIVAYAAAVVSFNSPKFREWIEFPASAYRPVAGLNIPQGVLWLTIGYLIVLYALYALVYALIYSSMRLTPYTPLDVKRPPKRRRRRRWRATFNKLAGVLGVIVAAGGSFWLVKLDLAHGWVSIPPSWYVPGPVPLAGVYIFLFIAILAVLWTLAALISGILTAFRSSSHRDYGDSDF